MNHKKGYRRLNRTAAHRRAMFRNMATALVMHDRIDTTLPKAKELRRIADRLVTLGKSDSLHNRRQAMKYLSLINRRAGYNAQKLSAVHRLFAEIAPRYSERHGGYTRVVRTRKRPGDNAQMAIIEFVEALTAKKESAPRRKRRVVAQTSSKAGSAASDSSVAAESAE